MAKVIPLTTLVNSVKTYTMQFSSKFHLLTLDFNATNSLAEESSLAGVTRVLAGIIKGNLFHGQYEFASLLFKLHLGRFLQPRDEKIRVGIRSCKGLNKEKLNSAMLDP